MYWVVTLDFSGRVIPLVQKTGIFQMPSPQSYDASGDRNDNYLGLITHNVYI